MTDADADPAADPEAAPEPEQFQNRAARRAKGKGAASHTGHSKGKVVGRSGTVQSPRQYGNRRSG